MCAGVGGLELGLRLAIGPEYRCVAYVEREAYPASTIAGHVANEILPEAAIWDDIRTFDGTPWRGAIHIVSTGFPCQGFSQAGRKRGIKDDRWLWPHIFRVVCECGAPFVFIENVPELWFSGAYWLMRHDLLGRGYQTAQEFFSAAEVGAPHPRIRFFALAVADDSAGWALHPTGCDMAWAHALQQKRPEDASRSEALPRWISEPAVCRVDDGTTHRLDRLRAIGEGVVPAVAARAWRILYQRLASDLVRYTMR